jgi:hypothetical protein
MPHPTKIWINIDLETAMAVTNQFPTWRNNIKDNGSISDTKFRKSTPPIKARRALEVFNITALANLKANHRANHPMHVLKVSKLFITKKIIN